MFLMSLIVQASLINIRNSIKTNYGVKFQDELKEKDQISHAEQLQLWIPPDRRQTLRMHVLQTLSLSLSYILFSGLEDREMGRYR